MGTLQLGLLTSSARAMGGIFDINKAGTGIGMSAALLGKLGNLAVTDAALKTRPPVRLACLITACAIRCSTPADLQQLFRQRAVQHGREWRRPAPTTPISA